MAILPDVNRAEVWAGLMRSWSASRDTIAINKTELRAAVNAIDTFLSDNEAAINGAIPLPARTSLTVQQKALLLMYVVQKRYLAGV